MACHECDLLQKIPALPVGATAKCCRCGALLYRHKSNSLERSLALTLSGLILFAIANAFPFLSFKIGAQIQETTLISGTIELFRQDLWSLAALVCFTCILSPLLQLLGIMYVLLPLKFGRTAWKMPQVFRLVQGLGPWGMMEVFMVGILVSVVKLAKMAAILPGISLYAFMALIFVLAGVVAVLDPHLIWERLDYRA
jgi:paraquat-inducible protein A